MQDEKKIKVAFVYLGRKGGGPIYSFEIAKELQDKAEVFYFVSKQVENKDDWEKNIKNVYFVDTYTNSFEFVLSFFRWRKFFELKRKLKEFSPNIIYYSFFHYWIALISLWFPKIPKIYTAHDPVLHTGEKSFLMKFLQDFLIKNSKRIIILSSIFKKYINKDESEIDVIPHGIFDYYKRKSFNEGRKEYKPTLLFFGRILEYKGLDILLKAFPTIKERVPGCRLIIAGSGNSVPYQELISGNSDIILENKWIADNEIASYFLESDVLVCPYRDASQSGAIPIAYAFKIPVVASRTGGLIEQVDDNRTGILVDVGNREQLVAACIKLLSKEDLRKQMGENGYNKAKFELSWERIGDKVFESFKKCL